MSPDPARAERVIAADRSASDAILEALVVVPQPADWPVRSNASWWLAAARFEEDERDAVRFLSSALGRWDDRGELYMRATPDDVAQALTEWYLAREAA